MIIQSYGLFWRADEVTWNPGKGKQWRLLGRRGVNSGTLEMADFRNQTGIYILYGDKGAHYVGLTKRRGLGLRLRDHLSDGHAGCWDRFCWFGFKPLKKQKDEQGLRMLKERMPEQKPFRPDQIIGDVEAMLINAMSVQNTNQMRFKKGQEWVQVRRDEHEKYMARL
jgi:hypothetical protein